MFASIGDEKIGKSQFPLVELSIILPIFHICICVCMYIPGYISSHTINTPSCSMKWDPLPREL